MKTVGLWIDHRKAVIVSNVDRKEEIKTIYSDVEKQLRRMPDGLMYNEHRPHEVKPDDKQQREFTKHLNIYYNEISSSIRDADSVMLFGPGEAKYEFKKRLEKNKLLYHIVAIEDLDKITDKEFAALVHKNFLNKKSKG